MMLCPMTFGVKEHEAVDYWDCKTTDCAWWCPSTKQCVTKVMLQELIYQTERRDR